MTKQFKNKIMNVNINTKKSPNLISNLFLGFVLAGLVIAIFGLINAL